MFDNSNTDTNSTNIVSSFEYSIIIQIPKYNLWETINTLKTRVYLLVLLQYF